MASESQLQGASDPEVTAQRSASAAVQHSAVHCASPRGTFESAPACAPLGPSPRRSAPRARCSRGRERSRQSTRERQARRGVRPQREQWGGGSQWLRQLRWRSGSRVFAPTLWPRASPWLLLHCTGRVNVSSWSDPPCTPAPLFRRGLMRNGCSAATRHRNEFLTNGKSQQ